MNPYLFRHLIYPAYELSTGRRVLPKWRELEKTQWLTPRELVEYQGSKLSAILQHAYQNVPFYRRRFEALGLTPGDIRSPSDLEKIPPLTKQDLSHNLTDLVATQFSSRQLHRNSTGGSTGEPTVFYNDQNDLDYRSAVVMRNYRWAGLELGQVHVLLWGSAFDLSISASLMGRLTNWLQNRHVLPAFEMSEAGLANFVKEILRLQPRLLTGYASALELLGRFILESHKGFHPPGLQAIVSSAETLYPHQREGIENAFGCRVFDRYGSREVGAIAHECERHRMHINTENLYIEVLQGGKPAPVGEYGELAITTLNNYGFPFIRYLIGDAGQLTDELCRCKRGLPLLNQLLGRVHDILVTPDGRFLPGEFFPHLFKEIPGVQGFQVIQKARDRLTIRILASPDYLPSSTDYLNQKTRQVMGENITITFEFVDELPLLPSGKLRFTISEVPVNFATGSDPG
jgi:phenylacetate-CoA ligase